MSPYYVHGAAAPSANKIELGGRCAGIGFASLDAAIAAAPLLFPSAATYVTHEGTVVWRSPAAQAWQDAAEATPGSVQWARRLAADLEPHLAAFAFEFGDWRVTAELNHGEYETFRGVIAPVFVVSAARGETEERALLSDIVNRRGSLQARRFAAAMPAASAAWRGLKVKPAPCYADLVAQIGDRLLPFAPLLYDKLGARRLLRIGAGSDEWDRVVRLLADDYVHLHEADSLSGKAAALRDALGRLADCHRGGCDTDGLASRCTGWAGRLSRKPPVDTDRLLADLGRTACCAIGVAENHYRDKLARLEQAIADGARDDDEGYDGSYCLLVDGAERAVELLPGRLERLVPHLPHGNWVAYRVGLSDGRWPTLRHGDAPELLRKVAILAGVEQASRIDLPGGVAALVPMPVDSVDSVDQIGADDIGFVVRLANAEVTGWAHWLTEDGGDMFRLIVGDCLPATDVAALATALRGHLERTLAALASH